MTVQQIEHKAFAYIAARLADAAHYAKLGKRAMAEWHAAEADHASDKLADWYRQHGMAVHSLYESRH